MKLQCANAEAERLIGLEHAWQAGQVLLTALKAGLFDLLGERPVSAKKLARELRLSDAALERLLACLGAMGLVEKNGRSYAAAQAAREHLCTKSPTYLGDFFLHGETLREQWSRLRQSLKTNCMAAPGRSRLKSYPRQLKRFLYAMDALGRIKSSAILSAFDAQRFTAMLDIGGGLGTYAAGFVRAHPQLRATVVDLPDVAAQARAYVRREGLQDRIQVVAAQCAQEALPAGPYDLVFISNLLHIYDAQDCGRIVRKAVRALKSKGTLLVHDYLFGQGDELGVALFDITMLVGTPAGRCYELDTLKRWMRAAGLKRIGSADVLAGTSIAWGLKP
ncbi:methyltransferase [Thermodesulfobacteriota bacterium]